MEFRVQFHKISTNGTKAETEEKSWKIQIVKMSIKPKKNH